MIVVGLQQKGLHSIAMIQLPLPQLNTKDFNPRFTILERSPGVSSVSFPTKFCWGFPAKNFLFYCSTIYKTIHQLVALSFSYLLFALLLVVCVCSKNTKSQPPSLNVGIIVVNLTNTNAKCTPPAYGNIKKQKSQNSQWDFIQGSNHAIRRW